MGICLCGAKGGRRPPMNSATAAPARFPALSDHIPVVVQHRHNDLVQELHQDREEHCEYLPLLHYRNVHHSVEEHEELEELLELVAEDHRTSTTRKRCARKLSPLPLFLLPLHPPLPHSILGHEPVNGELLDAGERGPGLTRDPGPLTAPAGAPQAAAPPPQQASLPASPALHLRSPPPPPPPSSCRPRAR